MSPQFVDFDADGKLDIVAGIFDGSPHLVRGTDKGWGLPEQILDRAGNRIVLNAFWNFETKKWDATHGHDARSTEREAHLTSAVAFDTDGDGDLDLLLGDHRSGHVYLRINEGTRDKPVFSTVNELVTANGQPIDVPGTVATLRLVDWNKDGLLDLACGSMGDAYEDGEGGGVYVFLNTGVKKAMFAAPLTLLERSKKGTSAPTRPDSGIYMDFGDQDGDGDLDMIVGGYSHWTPAAKTLTAEQTERVAELKAGIEEVGKTMQTLMDEIEKAVAGLDDAAATKKRDELFGARRDEFSAIGKKRQALQKELEPLEPGMKRESYVWLYENVVTVEAAASRKK
ncbi:MAG: FG-GAP-like repeat-containing protein [Planctomycetota bacterium]